MSAEDFDPATIDEPPRSTRICDRCRKPVCVDDHSDIECRFFAGKLERLRAEGKHPRDWEPEGWS